MNITQVYIMFNELPLINDKMSIKIGISNEPEDRKKQLQTNNPFPIHIIKTFNAGIEAQKHERHFHRKYIKYNTTGEWFEFTSQQFENEVLPEMIEYFNKIEVIKGEATVNSKTKLELCDINDSIKDVDDDSEYADIKLAQIHLGKAISIIEDGSKKRDYQLKLDTLQKIIDKRKKQSIEEGQEKLAIKLHKRKVYLARKRLEEFALNYMVGLGCASM
jgi:hypothetical protein